VLLHKLRLINFKRYRDQEIFFQDGITGIVGNNGTGKSSIVEAILFALFGLQGTGIDGNYIVSSFAGPRDACEVRLDFSVSGHDYTVIRRFRKRPSSAQHEAQLYINQKILADTVQKVSVEVQRAIGMNPIDFRYTIYAGQKDLLSLLESRPGSRKEWFMQVLGIDYLRKDSMEALRGLIDDCDKKYTGLSGRLAELDAGAVDRQLAEQGKELEDAGTMLGQIDEALASAERRVHESELDRERLQRVREQHIRLRSG